MTHIKESPAPYSCSSLAVVNSSLLLLGLTKQDYPKI